MFNTDAVPGVLAILATVLFGVLVFTLIFVPVPQANSQMVAGAVGLIGGSMAGAAFGYYFGSSKGSAAKDQTIANISKGAS